MTNVVIILPLSSVFCNNNFMISNPFGQTLKELRKAKGLSQEDLAEKLGVRSGKQTISNWELGKNEPTLSDIRKIAEVLGTTVGYLVDGENTKPPAVEEPKPGYITVPIEEYVETLRLANKQLTQERNKEE
ncbi:helix-turn-helix domain-containing protein [Spirosoma koreense]